MAYDGKSTAACAVQRSAAPGHSVLIGSPMPACVWCTCPWPPRQAGLCSLGSPCLCVCVVCPPPPPQAGRQAGLCSLGAPCLCVARVFLDGLLACLEGKRRRHRRIHLDVKWGGRETQTEWHGEQRQSAEVDPPFAHGVANHCRVFRHLPVRQPHWWAAPSRPSRLAWPAYPPPLSPQ